MKNMTDITDTSKQQQQPAMGGGMAGQFGTNMAGMGVG